MSRLDLPSRVTVKPGVNVFTGMACLSCLATLAALVFVILKYREIMS